ncbi:MAG: transketolase [Calditrichaeota bacterium]|nr:MAG: transketolase [Calditrichota bacterium]
MAFVLNDTENAEQELHICANQKRINFLKLKANQIRQQTLKVIYYGGSGHPGGSLSATDIMTALYFDIMKHDPKYPHLPDRDRFVLSKGHACPALYVILAECGYYSKEELRGFRQIGRMLQGHPEYGIPGIEVPTGSLGQGFSSSVGIALGLKLQNIPARVYVLLGDGELQEGQVWEAALFASHQRLGNLTIFIDYNKMQQDGFIEDTCTLEPLAQKWQAFNWHVESINGHDFQEILESVNQAKQIQDRPQVIIAHTIKGKGVSFMENVPRWHGTKPPTPQELETALQELQEEETWLKQNL